MENFIDYFKGNVFGFVQLTDAINVVPNKYSRVGDLGLFPFKGVPTTTIAIEKRDGVLNLLPTKERRSPPTGSSTGKRSMITFDIPHIPANDFIWPDDVQGVRVFGTSNQAATVEQVTMEKLDALAAKHFITWEWHRVGALHGIIRDADGGVIYNLFDEFGITEKKVYFDLDNANADLDAATLEVVRHTEDNLLGETMTQVHALCGSTWFDKFVGHPKMIEKYKYYSSMQEPLRNDVRRRFQHKGVVFEEYRGQADCLNADGTTTTRKFIADDEARFFPIGTQDTFRQYGAPANNLQSVNTIGVPMYVRPKPDQHGEFVELYSESNPLMLCKRPALLVCGKAGAAP